MNEEIDRLRAAILARSKTLYAFCRDHSLPHGTIYQVMRGRYAGNYEAQLKRIDKVLKNPPGHHAGPGEEKIINALSALACGQCEHGKRRCRKKRRQCLLLWTAQAAAMRKLWEVQSNEQDNSQ